MKIGIDIRTLNEGKITGVEVYAQNLLATLFRLDRANSYLLFNNQYYDKTQSFSFPQSIPTRRFRYPNRLLNLCFAFLSWPKIDQLMGGVDVFFSPRYLFGAWSSRTKLVITMHDVSFVRMPEFFSWQRRLWHWILSDRRACRRADLILTDSESTKKDVMELFKISEQKIRVIYPGIDHVQFEPQRVYGEQEILVSRFDLSNPYVLILATIEPRKNILQVIEAYERLRERRSDDIDLVIAGRLGWLYRNVLKRIKRSRWRDSIRLLNAVEESDKALLYRNAKVFVFSSFYEGFGFPPLEAMACGTPVIVAMNSSFPEVLGSAALYANPFDIEQLFRAIDSTLYDPKLRKGLIASGFEQAGKFSWEKTALQTLSAFEQVMGQV